MTSRYALYTIAELSNRFYAPDGLPKGVKAQYNNNPTMGAPVVISENGVPVVKLMKWGLIAKGAKDTNSVFRYKTYTIASESIFSRHSWELAVRHQRCLVPVNGFYELNGSGKKQAYYAELKDRSLFALDGDYSSWQDPDGVVHGTYSVITTEASADMPGFSTRMPNIISRDDEERWLNPEITDAGSIHVMLRPNPSDLLTVYEVSPDIHSPKPNLPRLIERI